MAYAAHVDEPTAEAPEGCLLFAVAMIVAAVMVVITGVLLLVVIH